MTPDSTTANRKASNDPNEPIAEATIKISPAAGPETPTREPEQIPTIIPPIIPAIMPEKTFASIPSTLVEDKPTPRHNGNATRNTTKLEGRSLPKFANNFFIKFLIDKELKWIHHF